MMATCDQDELASYNSFMFPELAGQIDFKVDPSIQNVLENIEILNIFLDLTLLGKDSFVPVGSCSDGSKVTTTNDSGDVDILVIAKRVNLQESLFDYDDEYPAFLHIKNEKEHKEIFAASELAENTKYLPTFVLKNMAYLHSFTKSIFNTLTFKTLSNEGDILSILRESAVGTEINNLYSQHAHDLGVLDEAQETRTWSYAFARMAFFGKYALETIDKLPWICSQADDSEDSSGSEGLFPKDFFKIADDVYKMLSQEPERRRHITRMTDSETSASDEASSNDVYDLDEEQNISDNETEIICVNDLNSFESIIQTHTNASPANQFIEEVKNESRKDSEIRRQHMEREQKYFEGNIKEPQTAHLKRHSSIDYVPAFRFDGWPRVANEWVHRRRRWPPKSVIKEIIKDGCQVVAKRPYALLFVENKKEGYDTDTYFRLSFALSEMKLAHAMNEWQLKCWRVLKAYQKAFLQTSPRVLTSYIWKNVFFWVCESFELSWTSESVLQGLFKCLDFMSACLHLRYLPFYFVPKMNLLNGCCDAQMDDVNRKIGMIRKSPTYHLHRFLIDPPKPEMYSVDVEELENKLSYEKIADSDNNNCKLMVDGFVCNSFTSVTGDSFDEERFITEHQRAMHKLIRTVRDRQRESKTEGRFTNSDLPPVEKARETEKTKVLELFEKMDVSKKESFEGCTKLISDILETIPEDTSFKDEDKRILDPMKSMFKRLNALFSEDEIDSNCLFDDLFRAFNAINDAKQAECEEMAAAGKITLQERVKWEACSSLFGRGLSYIKSHALPDTEISTVEQIQKKIETCDIELD